MRVTGSIGSPEVARQGDRSTLLPEELERRKKSSNPAIVGDTVVIQWHIGVHSQENHTTVKVERAAECSECHYLELGRHVRG